MKQFIFVTLIVFLTLSCFAESEEAGYQVSELAPNLYKLAIDGGGYDVKVLAFTGEDGLLLVETGLKEKAENLKKTLQTISEHEPVYIINSHDHMEHIGGNYIFGKEAIIVGHDNLRETLNSGANLFSEIPPELIPELTFSEPTTIYFNNEEIKLIPVIGSHTNNDIIVWFTKAKVAYVGAISNGKHFPSVDESGSTLKYKANVQKLLDLLPDDVKIIPGHGADGNMNDLHSFHKMLIDTEAIVRKKMNAGKTLKQMQDEDILKGYESYESYTNKALWINYLQEAIIGLPEPKEKIYTALYYEMKSNGTEAAIGRYHELKTNEPDRFDFSELDLFMIGYKLAEANKHLDSILFFVEHIKEYPKNEYIWLSYYNIGLSFQELEDYNKARINFEQSLEANPDNSYAKKALGELSLKE